jgi:hypothetical protein
LHNSGRRKRKTQNSATALARPAHAQDEASTEALERRHRREQFERQRADNDRMRDEARRKMFTHFRMWTVCPDKRCLRAQACAGNVEECLNERWRPVVPAELKTLLQKSLALMADGCTPQEAVAAAQAEMKRHAEAAARVDERFPQGAATPLPRPAPSPVAAPAPERHRGPRVRGF